MGRGDGAARVVAAAKADAAVVRVDVEACDNSSAAHDDIRDIRDDSMCDSACNGARDNTHDNDRDLADDAWAVSEEAEEARAG